MRLGRIILKIERIVDLDNEDHRDIAEACIYDEVHSSDLNYIEDPSLTEEDISPDIIDAIIEQDAQIDFEEDEEDDDYTTYSTKDPSLPTSGWKSNSNPLPNKGWSP